MSRTILSKNLPIDIVNYILSFDDRFVIRRGIVVNRLSKNIDTSELLLYLQCKPLILRQFLNFNCYFTTIYSSTDRKKNIYICISDNNIEYDLHDVNDLSLFYYSN